MRSVRAIYHSDPGGWWADSPDVPGWSATADGVDELRELVEEGVRFALDDADVLVYHRLEDGLQVSGIAFDFVRGEATVRQRPGSVEKGAEDLELVATH
ncbi:MAG TPA: hypothetical protein VGL78_10935 [Solirubrobacteraceae bacterium]|jgi:predicted RNase H-like HicB family nuclease